MTEHYFALAEAALKGADSTRIRVYNAISEHLTRGTIEPLSLVPRAFDPSRAARPAGGEGTKPAHRAPTATPDSIFQLIRAPDPIVADPRERTGTGTGRNGHELTERHYVKAHYKRQAYGPGQSLRQVICVEGYWRGPEPDDGYVPLERLADHRRPEGR